MARPPESIADAVRRFAPGEDRTTAVLAVACTIHTGFGAALVHEVTGADVDAASIEADLQVLTPAGRRVDLELIARDRGSTVRVWIEAKWDALWQPNQLADYAQALDDRGTLVAVVPAYRVHEVTPPTCALTWERIAVLADCQGIAVDGHAWRSIARRPDAPACQHILSLFLDHLETEHHMATSPLRTDHTVAIRLADEAITIADRLAEEAISRQALQLDKANKPGHWAHDTGAWWPFARTDDRGPTTWHPDGWPELMRLPDGARQDGPADPVFVCGLTLPKRAIERLEQVALTQWRAQIGAEPHRFTVWRDQNWTRVFTALPLAELATRSASFTGQVDYLARWLGDRLAAIRSFDPGVQWEGE